MKCAIAILATFLFIAVAAIVMQAYEIGNLSKKLDKAEMELIAAKPKANTRLFTNKKRNIRDICSSIEVPFEYADHITDSEMVEALLNEMHPQLACALDYMTEKDFMNLKTICAGRIMVVEGE